MNQRLPSAPGAIQYAKLPAFRPLVNSVICPLGVIRPIACVVVPWSVNHRLPSAPGAIANGRLPAFRPLVNSVIGALGVIRPIALVGPVSVNHRSPSGPGAIPAGMLPGVQTAGELGDLPARGDPPDLRGRTRVGEPKVAV